MTINKEDQINDINIIEEYVDSVNNYEKKSLKLYNDGEALLQPSDINFLGEDALNPIYKLFTNMIGSNLGTNVALEMGNFQSIWREEMSEVTSTKTNSLSKIHIKMNELVSAPLVSRRALSISTLNLKEYIRNNVEISFSQQIDRALLFGDGIKEPKGILQYVEDKDKEGKPLITVVNMEKNNIINSLLEMENRLPRIYKKQAVWLMSRSMHQLIQKGFYTQKDSHFVINRDDINYRLLNRKLYICDELDSESNINKVFCILAHPMAYTTIENSNVEIIENNLELDVKLIFIKYFGGALTDPKAILLGTLV